MARCGGVPPARRLAGGCSPQSPTSGNTAPVALPDGSVVLASPADPEGRTSHRHFVVNMQILNSEYAAALKMKRSGGFGM